MKVKKRWRKKKTAGKRDEKRKSMRENCVKKLTSKGKDRQRERQT
jgi:hypothetical protein